ncbi:MAG: TonB family protein, partial [Aureispira sp.]|nr:TonB family protein [Aureispira sp.]
NSLSFEDIKFDKNESLIHLIDKEVDEAFFEASVKNGSFDAKGKDDFKIVSEDNTDNLNLERPPLYLGGKIGILKKVYTNIRYPNLARENGIQGTVKIKFMVNQDGKLSNYTILENIGGGCGEEALRMIKILNDGFWIPGIANGEFVSTTYTIPIRFKLN